MENLLLLKLVKKIWRNILKDKLIVITGPTASGKSDIAINIAKYLDSSVISADSQQVYRDMDIGTNKTYNFEVDHYMINIVDPDQNYSVEDFSTEAKSIVRDINNNLRIPIIAGGTGFYIDSLLFDMNYGNVKKDEIYRRELENLAKEKGKQYLYDKLLSIDPITANRYHPNELNRIIRSLEIHHVSGKLPSDMRIGERKLNQNIEPIIFFLNYNNRDLLYDKINNRVLKMIDEGLVSEVESLIKIYNLDKNSQSMAAIGYKEVLEYINGSISGDEMINLIQRNTRRYVKRQITWMKKYLKYGFGHEIMMDNLNKNDASDIILDIIKGAYEL